MPGDDSERAADFAGRSRRQPDAGTLQVPGWICDRKIRVAVLTCAGNTAKFPHDVRFPPSQIRNAVGDAAGESRASAVRRAIQPAA